MSSPAPALPLPTASPQLASRLLGSLAAVDELMAQQVRDDDAFVAQASGHLHEAGGKRFRPLLTLLVAELGTGANPEVVAAAAGVELTHLASLYHDDVMDEATVRRGVVSANVLYDNSTAILVGDLLFGRASDLIAQLGAEAVRIQSRTFIRLCSGQIRDARPVPADADPVAYYLGVLADKTGALIATAARYGAMFSHCEPELVGRMRTFGEQIGVAFQLADDLLDIASDGTQSGKTPGTDLREGVATLPIIYARASDDPRDARLRELLGLDLRDDTLHAETLDLLRGNPAMQRARATTQAMGRAAQDLLDPLPDSDAKTALIALAESVVDRAG